jgi:hypothetical protein
VTFALSFVIYWLLMRREVVASVNAKP